MTQNQLQTLTNNYWLDYCEIFPALVKFDPPKIILSNRLTKCAGYNSSAENSVTLSSKFIGKFEGNMILVILPHEIAHQIDFNLYGWQKFKKHHGKCWKYVMQKIGQPPEPYHTMVL